MFKHLEANWQACYRQYRFLDLVFTTNIGVCWLSLFKKLLLLVDTAHAGSVVAQVVVFPSTQPPSWPGVVLPTGAPHRSAFPLVEEVSWVSSHYPVVTEASSSPRIFVRLPPNIWSQLVRTRVVGCRALLVPHCSQPH